MQTKLLSLFDAALTYVAGSSPARASVPFQSILDSTVRPTGFAHRVRRPIAAAAVIAVVALPFAEHGARAGPACDVPFSMIRFTNPLVRVAQRLKSGEPITIVAIGSSSTAGTGASSSVASYPSRLAVELSQHFPGRPITVLNRGVGGEEIRDMLERFDTDVIATKPDLVLWQFGTNSVIHDNKFNNYSVAIREGLTKIRSTGADIVLIDPQFVQKVIVKSEATRMVELIASTAKHENVDLFRRFDVMRRWHEVDHIAFKTFVSADRLHMNDWSYGCFAKGLGMAIAEAAQRPVVSAKAMSHLLR
jgi:acyl-CoA thioesterase I